MYFFNADTVYPITYGLFKYYSYLLYSILSTVYPTYVRFLLILFYVFQLQGHDLWLLTFFRFAAHFKKWYTHTYPYVPWSKHGIRKSHGHPPSVGNPSAIFWVPRDGAMAIPCRYITQNLIVAHMDDMHWYAHIIPDLLYLSIFHHWMPMSLPNPI